MALLASLISIRIAIPVALVEILVGAVAGNVPGVREHIDQTAFVIFLAGAGSIILTFLAGAEIDPVRCADIGRPASRSGRCRSCCPSAGTVGGRPVPAAVAEVLQAFRSYEIDQRGQSPWTVQTRCDRSAATWAATHLAAPSTSAASRSPSSTPSGGKGLRGWQ